MPRDDGGGVEGGVGRRFNAATAAQEGAYCDVVGGMAGGVGGKVLVEEIAEKDIGFGVQLLVTLHCFSGLTSLLEMVEKDNICVGGVVFEATVEIEEKDSDF